MSNDTIVSICCITYNHGSFIAQTIEGFLMQKTEFPFEIIIGEDCSTDDTLFIIQQYLEKNPGKIRVISSEKNVGPVENEFRTLLAASGTYIALCEGDDYWTDPYKLQKQVELMNQHPELSLTCHRYNTYDCAAKIYLPDKLDDFFRLGSGFEVSMDLFLKEWIIKNLTIMFRRQAFDPLLIKKYHYYRDLHLIYHLLKAGKGYCMNFIGGVYRKHTDGIHSSVGILMQSKNSYFAAYDLYRVQLSDELKQYYLNKLQWVIDTMVQHSSGIFYTFRFAVRHFIETGSGYQFVKNCFKILKFR